VGIEREGVAVDPAVLADLARRMDSESSLIVAAQLALSTGDGDLARSLLPEAVAHSLRRDVQLTARTCVEAGFLELAEGSLTGWVPSYPAEEAARLGAQGILASARREYGTACARLSRAAASWAELRMVPAQAYALLEEGRSRLALGQVEGGASRLKESRALWHGMGAAPRVLEIDTLLAELGRG
jgi:hypothetical protein